MFTQPRSSATPIPVNAIQAMATKLKSEDVAQRESALAQFKALGGFAQLFSTVLYTTNLNAAQEQKFRDALKCLFEKFSTNGVNAISSGTTCLILAVRNIRLIAVERMLAIGADANYQTKDLMTPLGMCGTVAWNAGDNKQHFNECRQALAKIIRALVAAGANINICNANNYTPLCTALSLKMHMRLDQVDEFLKITNIDLNTYTIQDWVNPIYLAVQMNNNADLVKLIAAGADATLTPPKRPGPLFLALSKLSWECARTLLEHGASPSESKNSLGFSPLDWAVLHYTESKDKDEKFTIILLIKLLLVKGANPRATLSTGSALTLIFERHSLELFECFAGAGVDFKAACDSKGRTPMMIAAQRGYQELINRLTRHGVSIQDVTEKNCNLLHYASLGKQRALVKQYLPNLRHLINEVDNQGFSVLYCASEGGDAEIVSLLLRNGADTRITNANLATALHVAAMKGHADVIAMLTPHCNVNTTMPNGSTALMFAATAGHRDAVEILIRCGADVTLFDQSGATALHYALSCGHSDIVTLLRQQHDNMHAVFEFFNLAVGTNIFPEGEMSAELIINGVNIPRKVAHVDRSKPSEAATTTPARLDHLDDLTDADIVSGFQYLKNRGLNPDDYAFDKTMTETTSSASSTASPPQAFSWFDGRLQSTSDVIESIDSKYGTKNCYLYIDEKNLRQQGCDDEKLTRVRKMRCKFAASVGEIGIVKLEGKLPLNVTHDDTTETVNLGYEIKLLNTPARILCYRQPSDDNKSILFIACVYAPNGLHLTSDDTRLKTKIALTLPERAPEARSSLRM